MYDSVITLISETDTVDEYGDTVTTQTTRNIFAEVQSISQTEFYQAQALGLKPEIKFVIADFADYQNGKNSNTHLLVVQSRLITFCGHIETNKHLKLYATEVLNECSEVGN